MKLLIVLLLVAVVLYNVDASHKKHKTMKSEDIAEADDSWPSPTVINNFDAPEDFHHHDGDDDHGHNEDDGHRHHWSH